MPQTDRTLSQDVIERAVSAVSPTWAVRATESVDTGTTAVARVTVDTGDGRRECVLKTSPDGVQAGIDTEARLLALLSARTAIPVPEPLGVVDDHHRLPAPLLLMRAVPGESVARTDLDRLSATTAERVARQVGRHLAELHAVDAVDAFGYLEPTERGLTGERPPADADTIRVVEAETDWRATVRTFAERELEALGESRIADLAPEVERALDERIDRLDGPFDPVLAHVDGLLENVRVDGESEVQGLLDWGFTIAATPAYDLVHVAGGLGGGPWTLGDPVAWEDRARAALVEGDRECAPPEHVEQYRANRSCHDLLRLARQGAHVEEWLALQDLDGPERVATAARALRERIEASLA